MSKLSTSVILLVKKDKNMDLVLTTELLEYTLKFLHKREVFKYRDGILKGLSYEIDFENVDEN
jgi:hypothetical protein